MAKNVKKSKLPNGLRVVTHTNKAVQSFVAAVGVKVGSRYETDKQNGVSHALEHMLFKGTENRSSDELNEVVDFLGASTNAFTSTKETVYYIKGALGDLEASVDVLADQVLRSNFPQEELEKEMEVIQQEIKRYADDIDSVAYEMFMDKAYTGHPLSKKILGSPENVAGFAKNDILREYFKTYYNVKNMVLVVVGNVKHKDVVEMAARHFNVVGTPFKNKKIKKAPWTSGVVTNHDESKQQVSVIIGYPSRTKKEMTLRERVALNVIDSVLSGGMSSKLFREIREKRGLVYSVGSHASVDDESGGLMITGGTDHEKLDEFIEATHLVLSRFAEDLTDKDLQKAKNSIRVHAANSSENTHGTAVAHVRKMLSDNAPVDNTESLKVLEEITKEDLINLSNEIFSKAPVIAINGYAPQIENKEVTDGYLKLLSSVKN